MDIHLATTNKGKVHSLNNNLLKYGIKVVHHHIELPEPRSDDLRAIAKEKVLFAFDKIKQPCIALDSGFFIPSLNGFPRAFVNFALETIGVDGILKLVDGADRKCEFRSCLAYFDETLDEPLYFESVVPGSLAESKKGVMQNHYWSELFLVFIPDDRDMTLSEMSTEEYHRWKEEKSKDYFGDKFGAWITER